MSDSENSMSAFDAAISSVMGEVEEPAGQPEAEAADEEPTQPGTDVTIDGDDGDDEDPDEGQPDDDDGDGDDEAAADESDDEDDDGDADDDDPEQYDSEEFEIDGEKLTRKEVRELKAKEKNLQAGYTKKYQELAQERKQVTENLDRSKQTLGLIQEQLSAPLKQFDGIDWQALQANDPAKYQQLRGQYQHALNGYRQVEQALSGIQQQVQAQQKAEIARKAKDAREVLQTQHPDWSTELYREVIDFAEAQGVPREEIANETRPWVISAMLNQMRAEKARDIKTQPKTNSVKRTIKQKAVPKERSPKQKRADQLKRDRALAAKGDRRAQNRVAESAVESHIDRVLDSI